MDIREKVDIKYDIYENGNGFNDMCDVIKKQMMYLSCFKPMIKNIEFSRDVVSILCNTPFSFHQTEENTDGWSTEQIINGMKDGSIVGGCLGFDYTINEELSGENWIKVNLK